MNILIVSTYYHPHQNPRAIRWTVYAESLVAMGHNVAVLTSIKDGLRGKSTEYGVGVHRVGFANLSDWFNNLTNKPQRRSSKSKGTRKTGIANWIINTIINLIWRPNYWPDGSVVWKKRAVKYAHDQFKSNSFDLLVSVSNPFTSHSVAGVLRRSLNIPAWWIDIGDPLSFHHLLPKNNFSRFNERNIDFEQELLIEADVVSVPNGSLKTAYISRFQVPNPLLIMPPVASKFLSRSSKDKPHLSSNHIHIGYFGSFYRNIREPGRLMDVLKSLEKYDPLYFSTIRIHFFGYIEPEFIDALIYSKLPKDSVQIHGLVNSDQIWPYIEAMNYLISIGNDTPDLLPSKVADYVLSGKAIIHLTQCTPDPCLAFFDRFEANYCVVDHASMAKEIQDFLKSNSACSGNISSKAKQTLNPRTQLVKTLEHFIPHDETSH